jgi:hypothetical protein
MAASMAVCEGLLTTAAETEGIHASSEKMPARPHFRKLGEIEIIGEIKDY